MLVVLQLPKHCTDVVTALHRHHSTPCNNSSTAVDSKYDQTGQSSGVKHSHYVMCAVKSPREDRRVCSVMHPEVWRSRRSSLSAPLPAKLPTSTALGAPKTPLPVCSSYVPRCRKALHAHLRLEVDTLQQQLLHAATCLLLRRQRVQHCPLLRPTARSSAGHTRARRSCLQAPRACAWPPPPP